VTLRDVSTHRSGGRASCGVSVKVRSARKVSGTFPEYWRSSASSSASACAACRKRSCRSSSLRVCRPSQIPRQAQYGLHKAPQTPQRGLGTNQDDLLQLIGVLGDLHVAALLRGKLCLERLDLVLRCSPALGAGLYHSARGGRSWTSFKHQPAAAPSGAVDSAVGPPGCAERESPWSSSPCSASRRARRSAASRSTAQRPDAHCLHPRRPQARWLSTGAARPRAAARAATWLSPGLQTCSLALLDLSAPG